MRNLEVVEMWLQSESASSKNGNIHTNGFDIFSYRARIGFTKNGRKVLIDYTAGSKSFISATTSKHCGIVRRKADYWLNPSIKFWNMDIHREIEIYESKNQKEKIEWIRGFMHKDSFIDTETAMHISSFIKVLEEDPVVLQYFVEHARERFQEKDKELIKKFGFLVDILR